MADSAAAVPEPAIIGFGRQNRSAYKEEDFKEALERAFVDKGADFITLDSNMRGQQFTAAGVSWGLDHGWLRMDFVDDSDEQCEVYSFRLTEEGKKALGIA